MKSTADKYTTLRAATAQARVVARAATLDALMAGTTPKGHAVEIARVAGILAAKRTWELIPYCHPLPIDQIRVDIVREGDALVVTAVVIAVWKTGVEMEALTAASMTALTLYDMAKPIDTDVRITDICVREKRGGKTDYANMASAGFRVAILVTSDGTFGGHREDHSGRLIEQRLRDHGLTAPAYRVVSDDRDVIIHTLREWIAEGYDLILTTGGTGLGPRDVTVEATRAVIDRELPGVAEAMRAHGQQRTPYAMLSRGIAGAAGRTIIVNLPGSSRGVKESLDAVFPALLHAYPMMGGAGHAAGLGAL